MARRRRHRSRLGLALLAVVALSSLLWCRRRIQGAPPPPPPPRSSAYAIPSAAPPPNVAHLSPWSSRQDCEALLSAGQRLPRPTGMARLASWNLRWFPYGRLPSASTPLRTDVAWVACSLAWVDVDAVAVQEIVRDERGLAAMQDLLARLDRLTRGAWTASFDDCRGRGRQHVGLLVNTHVVRVSDAVPVAALNPGNGACDLNLRPGFGGYLRWPGGPDLHFVSVHLDSGSTRRDFEHRRTSWARVADAFGQLQSQERDSDVIIAGDLNTMGCEGPAGCESTVTSEGELESLSRTLGSLRTPFRRLESDLPCTEYYRGRGHALDHVLVPASFQELPAGSKATVQGDCAAARCSPRTGDTPAYTHLSDHCPVVVDIPRVDRDD